MPPKRPPSFVYRRSRMFTRRVVYKVLGPGMVNVIPGWGYDQEVENRILRESMNMYNGNGRRARTPGVETGTPGVETGTPGVETGTPGVETGTPGVETGTLDVGAATPSVGAATPSVGAGTSGVGAATPSVGVGMPAAGAGTPGTGTGGECTAAASSNATATVLKTDNGLVINGNSSGGGYVYQTLGDNNETTASEITGLENQMVPTVRLDDCSRQSELSTVQEGSQSNKAGLKVLIDKIVKAIQEGSQPNEADMTVLINKMVSSLEAIASYDHWCSIKKFSEHIPDEHKKKAWILQQKRAMRRIKCIEKGINVQHLLKEYYDEQE